MSGLPTRPLLDPKRMRTSLKRPGDGHLHGVDRRRLAGRACVDFRHVAADGPQRSSTTLVAAFNKLPFWHPLRGTGGITAY